MSLPGVPASSAPYRRTEGSIAEQDDKTRADGCQQPARPLGAFAAPERRARARQLSAERRYPAKERSNARERQWTLLLGSTCLLGTLACGGRTAPGEITGNSSTGRSRNSSTGGNFTGGSGNSSTGRSRTGSTGGSYNKAPCPPGQVRSKKATVSAERKCTACPEGTFARGPEETSCTPWQVCPWTEEELRAGSATQDVVCTMGSSNEVRQLGTPSNDYGTGIAIDSQLSTATLLGGMISSCAASNPMGTGLDNSAPRIVTTAKALSMRTPTAIWSEVPEVPSKGKTRATTML